MSGARYSHHLHAEEAAGSLEALIRDYESRGRRLRACQQALLQAMDQHPDLAVFFEEALVASGEEVLTEAEQLHETGPSLWAAQPLLLSWALFYAAYVGAAAWLARALGAGPPADLWDAALAPLAHGDFGPRGALPARVAWYAMLAAYLVLGPLLLCLCACARWRAGLPRLGAPNPNPNPDPDPDPDHDPDPDSDPDPDPDPGPNQVRRRYEISYNAPESDEVVMGLFDPQKFSFNPAGTQAPLRENAAQKSGVENYLDRRNIYRRAFPDLRFQASQHLSHARNGEIVGRS